MRKERKMKYFFQVASGDSEIGYIDVVSYKITMFYASFDDLRIKTSVIL